MMRSYDVLRCIDRFARMTAGWGLGSIQAQSALKPLAPGEVRFWSKKKGRWMRSNRALNDTAPELPDSMVNLAEQRVLVLCMDQASTNNAVANFLPSPGGFHGCILAAEDPFHRAYNDWKFAIRHSYGGFEHTVLHMTVVYNLP